MDDVVKLVNLPWATLVTLASGYAAYYIANVGVRDHHKPIDVAFSTLVFGFFSAFAYAVCRRRYGADLLAASVFAFGAALVIGASWSLFGRATFERLLRRSQVSLSDDLPSAWMASKDLRYATFGQTQGWLLGQMRGPERLHRVSERTVRSRR